MEDLGHGDIQFCAGRFSDARQCYTSAIRNDPECHEAYLRLGEIDLLSNRLDDAIPSLEKALTLKPEENRVKALLAELHYRRDDFQKAAVLLRDVGREAKAAKLESLIGATPYLMDGPEATTLRFELTDPLPLVRIQVGDLDPVLFLIDTGGAELVLDSEFAEEVGASRFGPEMGTFAGGLKAAYYHGAVDKVKLGDLCIHNVPVNIMETRRFGSIFGGRRVDGVIGTVLLYHFIPTLDYVREQLVLRRRTRRNLQQQEQDEKHHSITMPFWLAGDHYIHAWGTVNRSEPMLFLVDTGLAGGGFTCPESTLRKANIKLQEDKASEGLGGGGKVRVIPFTVDELTLGEALQNRIRGLYSGGQDEYRHGFHCGGIISHAFFRPYTLTIDFDEMQLFLRKA